MNQNKSPPAPGTIQRLLEENTQLIMCIAENQNKGNAAECISYQQVLHRNLVYLATIADYNQQNTVQPNINFDKPNHPINNLNNSDVSNNIITNNFLTPPMDTNSYYGEKRSIPLFDKQASTSVTLYPQNNSVNHNSSGIYLQTNALSDQHPRFMINRPGYMPSSNTNNNFHSNPTVRFPSPNQQAYNYAMPSYSQNNIPMNSLLPHEPLSYSSQSLFVPPTNTFHNHPGYSQMAPASNIAYNMETNLYPGQYGLNPSQQENGYYPMVQNNAQLNTALSIGLSHGTVTQSNYNNVAAFKSVPNDYSNNISTTQLTNFSSTYNPEPPPSNLDPNNVINKNLHANSKS